MRFLIPFRLGRRGIAAVEFALIVPVLLVLFIGTIEVLTLYRTEAKLNAMAINIAQMVAVTQSADPAASSYNGTTATVTSLNDICNGAILGLAPFPASQLKVNIASVTLEPSALNSNSPAVTPAFDEWEQDYTETTTSKCQTATGTVMLSGTGATAPISVAKTNSSTGNSSGTTTLGTGIFEEPCDNVIIVQASIVYPGLIGFVLQNAPTLTQTAYARWITASTLTQFLCANCTKIPAQPFDYCKSSNTATH